VNLSPYVITTKKKKIWRKIFSIKMEGAALWEHLGPGKFDFAITK
jgi:hypothetical protein